MKIYYPIILLLVASMLFPDISVPGCGIVLAYKTLNLSNSMPTTNTAYRINEEMTASGGYNTKSLMIIPFFIEYHEWSGGSGQQYVLNMGVSDNLNSWGSDHSYVKLQMLPSAPLIYDQLYYSIGTSVDGSTKSQGSTLWPAGSNYDSGFGMGRMLYLGIENFYHGVSTRTWVSLFDSDAANFGSPIVRFESYGGGWAASYPRLELLANGYNHKLVIKLYDGYYINGLPSSFTIYDVGYDFENSFNLSPQRLKVTDWY